MIDIKIKITIISSLLAVIMSIIMKTYYDIHRF